MRWRRANTGGCGTRRASRPASSAGGRRGRSPSWTTTTRVGACCRWPQPSSCITPPCVNKRRCAEQPGPIARQYELQGLSMLLSPNLEQARFCGEQGRRSSTGPSRRPCCTRATPTSSATRGRRASSTTTCGRTARGGPPCGAPSAACSAARPQDTDRCGMPDNSVRSAVTDRPPAHSHCREHNCARWSDCRCQEACDLPLVGGDAS